MVLLNRRGYSSVVLCRACGETLQCKNCTIAMTFHKAAHRMECHYCGYRQAVHQALHGVQQRTHFLSGHGVRESGRAAALGVSAGAHSDGMGRRYGAQSA